MQCRPGQGTDVIWRSVDMHVQQLSWQDQAGWQGADVGPGRSGIALRFGARGALKAITVTTIAEVID
jgi:hypothetical protein